MRRPDERVIRALCALEDNPNFKVIREWFLASAGDLDNVLRKAEPTVAIYRAQGASRELLEFCELAAEPREKATRMAMERAGIHSIPNN